MKIEGGPRKEEEEVVEEVVFFCENKEERAQGYVSNRVLSKLLQTCHCVFPCSVTERA